MTGKLNPEMTSAISHKVMTELLGRGLSYKQWRLVLSGEIFNDCIGGRYFTEWQYALNCQSFTCDKTIRRRIIDLEFEMFRDEIVCMLQEGYTFKCIARRLRGDVWRDDGIEERIERLRMRRLFGTDARSRTFRIAVKKWKVKLAPVRYTMLPNFQQGSKCIEQPSHALQDSQYSTRYQASAQPGFVPRATVTRKSSLSFRRSFGISTLPTKNEHPPPIPIHACRTAHEAGDQRSLQQAIANLKLRSQQSRDQLQAMKAELHSIRAGLQEHEREIVVLQQQQGGGGGGPVQEPLLPTIVDEFDEMLWEKKDELKRCRSRRRGRVFYYNEATTSPLPAVDNRSRIPIRATTPRVDEMTAGEDDFRFAARGSSALHVVTHEREENEDKIQRHRRGANQNRDSGYASPTSINGSVDSISAVHIRLADVRE